MRRYETLIVLHPELPEAQIRETQDRLRRLIGDMGGECHQLQEWGMRDLAYPIRKQSRGYYLLVEYSGKPEVLREIERTLKIGDEFLRFVSVVVPAVQQVEKPGKAGKPRSIAPRDAGLTDSDAFGS
jgi:small subunit ribosomal protein S6